MDVAVALKRSQSTHRRLDSGRAAESFVHAETLLNETSGAMNAPSDALDEAPALPRGVSSDEQRTIVSAVRNEKRLVAYHLRRAAWLYNKVNRNRDVRTVVLHDSAIHVCR